jgi:hypothetical protein
VRTQPTTPLGAAARGIAAGLAGTYALDLAQKAASKLRGEETRSEWKSWDEAPAPAKVGKRIIEGVGAWAVAPLAAEWIHVAVLAIRAEIPLRVLADTMAQFPTYSEGYLSVIRALE